MAKPGNAKTPIKDRVFIDSNIFLYAIDRGQPRKRKLARKLIQSALAGNVVISTQVIQEFYAIATRKLGVSPLAARRVLEQLDNFEIVNIDRAIILDAIDCSILSQISFWDALIICGASAAGCKIVYTEDLNNSQIIRGVRIVNPLI